MPALHAPQRVPQVVNPFVVAPVVSTPLTWALVGVTLFPLRLAVLCVAIPCGALLATVATLGHDASTPLSPLRRAALQPLRLVFRAVLWSWGFVWISVEKRPGCSAPGAARVLVSAPHYSIVDPAVLNYLELPMAISKKAVGDMPLIGTIARALSTIFVDRKDKASKHRAAAAIRERARGGGWPPLLVFPEGTCTNGQALITFKEGAFLPGVPVQPVLLRYPFSNLSVSSAASGSYRRLFLGMLQPTNRLHVTYLPVCTPTEDEVADPSLFARNVRATMAAELGVGVTAHS